MKTFVKAILLLFALCSAGCWNMYNDTNDDKENEYQFHLAVASTCLFFTYSMDSDSQT